MFGSSANSPSYNVRRSNVKSSNVESDGDVWHEKLAVCESATNDGRPKLLIRSYFRNERTGDRLWDEAPSGASRIHYATAEMRRMAQTQMDELQLTLEMIPSENDDIASSDISKYPDTTKNEKSSKKSIFGRFGKKKERKTVEVSKDLNLQRAIARSMSDGYPSQNNPRRTSYDEEDPDIAFAKALSISESHSSQRWKQEDDCDALNGLTEEEMLERAIEASRRDLGKNNIVAVNQVS
jgi:hypothetical protein